MVESQATLKQKYRHWNLNYQPHKEDRTNYSRKIWIFKLKCRIKMPRHITYHFKIRNYRPITTISFKCSKLMKSRSTLKQKKSSNFKAKSRIIQRVACLKGKNVRCWSGNCLKRRKWWTRRKMNGKKKGKGCQRCGKRGYRQQRKQCTKKKKAFTMRFKAWKSMG